MSEPIPSVGMNLAPGRYSASGIKDAVIASALRAGTVEEFFIALGPLLRSSSLAVGRLFLSLQTIHPAFRARTYLRHDGDNRVNIVEWPHGLRNRPGYSHSPDCHVHSTGMELRVRDLQNVGPSRCDLYGKLRAESYTDYLIVPLPFSDGTVNTLSIATRRPGGFPAASLNWYRRVVDLLVIVFERYAVLETRSAALETYLGRGVAQEVLKGRIRSGYGEEIEAAILFADLNGFTRLSSNLTPLATVRLLNTYFDCLVGPIEEHGGYVLKFIGDAILAFFPLGPEASASRPVDAVRAIRQRLGELNEARTVAGDEPLSHAVCAHRGRVLYGNVGSSERLDFTVIGEAVNIAARGVDTAKMLGVEYVFTRPFVESFVDSELTYLGSHAMEGVTGSFAFYSFKDDRPDEL